ncbi:hypothetical protein [Micromonospora musae]|uniref:hypothetical protein n=1 Tax=Micromonospora musae TaxID=1894970 RepID=UPI0034002E15
MKKLAVAAPFAWLAWLALTDWVPMSPLNDLAAIPAGDRAIAAVANYPFPLLIAAGIALDRHWSRIAAVALSALCLIGHVASWWVPYFGSANPTQRAEFQEYYAQTLRFWPTGGHDVVIDLQHAVVGLLTLAMLTTTVLVTMRRWPRQGNHGRPAAAAVARHS